MTDQAEQAVRRRLVELARRMLLSGLVHGTSGNLSARFGDTVLVTPSGVPYEEMEPEAVVAVALAGGTVREGALKPSVDTPVHLALYRARPDAAGVVHTHSPHATAFAIARRAIPALHAELAGFLGGEVPCLDYVPPARDDTGERVAVALGRGRAALLPNHGVVAVGETLDRAFAAAQAVEDAARVAILSAQVGDPVPPPGGEVERMHEFIHQRYGQR